MLPKLSLLLISGFLAKKAAHRKISRFFLFPREISQNSGHVISVAVTEKE